MGQPVGTVHSDVHGNDRLAPRQPERAAAVGRLTPAATVLGLQGHSGNAAVARWLQSRRDLARAALQRAPARFGPKGGLAVWEHTPGWAMAWEPTSPYRLLQDSLKAYAETPDDRTNDRVERLMQLAKNVQRWRDHHKVGEAGVELAKDERAKLAALDELRDAIGEEWAELGTRRTGTLEAADAEEQAAVDPALTRKMSRGEKAIGFFNRATDILNKDGDVRHRVAADVLCTATREGAPEGSKPVDFWWVAPADRALQGVEIFGDQSKNHAVFPEGYAPVISVSIGSRVEPAAGLRYSDRSDRALFPLFPREPNVADVRQLGLGDCWLEAAMISLAATNSGHIRSMMRDNGETVTVSMFDVDTGPPKRFTARRITVNKSVPTHQRGGDEAFSGGALWAQLLQKAYTAAGYQGDSPETMPIARAASYGRIESGNSNIAFEHLTGQAATIELIAPVDYEHFNKNKTWVSSTEFNEAVTNPARDEVQLLAETDASNKRIDDLVAMVKQWANIAKVIEAGVRTVHEQNAQPRLGDIEALITRVVPASLGDFRTRAIAWVRAQRIYPGKRGTGVTTAAQDALFQQIKTAVDAGRLVAVGSNRKIATESRAMGVSAREDQAKGLLGPHGYALVGTATSDDLNVSVHPKPNPPLKFVKLRNPWGRYGREYFTSRSPEGHPRVTAREKAKGEFWLLLEDLTKRFNQVSIGEIADAEREI